MNRFRRWVANPVMKRVAGYLPGHALLETIGRKSGRARRTPFGGDGPGLSTGSSPTTATVLSTSATLKPTPQVRIQIHGRRHDGIAQTVPDDNPAERLRKLPRFNSMLVRSLGTDLLTVRVTLR
jgi:hypothetical protein